MIEKKLFYFKNFLQEEHQYQKKLNTFAKKGGPNAFFKLIKINSSKSIDFYALLSTALTLIIANV